MSLCDTFQSLCDTFQPLCPEQNSSITCSLPLEHRMVFLAKCCPLKYIKKKSVVHWPGAHCQAPCSNCDFLRIIMIHTKPKVNTVKSWFWHFLRQFTYAVQLKCCLHTFQVQRTEFCIPVIVYDVQLEVWLAQHIAQPYLRSFFRGQTCCSSHHHVSAFKHHFSTSRSRNKVKNCLCPCLIGFLLVWPLTPFHFSPPLKEFLRKFHWSMWVTWQRRQVLSWSYKQIDPCGNSVQFGRVYLCAQKSP